MIADSQYKLRHTGCAKRRVLNTAAGRYCGFTVAELIVVIVIVSMFVMLVQVRLFGLLGRDRFRAQIQEFVSAMQMAVNAAAESERRYEVVIDFTEQNYLMRQITSPDLSEVLKEEIIVQNDFSDKCIAVYVLFDDFDYTDSGIAKFRAGHSGWQYGGKIVFFDEEQQPYSVVVNRMNRIVVLKHDDVVFTVPKAENEILF